MKNNKWYIALTLGLGLGLILALFWLLTGQPVAVQADLATRFVATDGDDANDCNSIGQRCRTIQRAIDVAGAFDEIWVATGAYTDPAGTVADIAKTVTLLGGWDEGFTTRDPNIYPTVLDAERNGRVVYIHGTISPTIDGFIITGGNASNDPLSKVGGGICSAYASPIIQNNVITNNIAYTGTTPWGKGGGIYLYDASASTLISGNRILSNTASTTHYGLGGGLASFDSAAQVIGNEIRHNTGGRGGGGVYLNECYDITFEGNLVVSNTATLSPTLSGRGGGFYLEYVAPFTLTNNVIAQNYANAGGGMYIYGFGSYYAAGALVNNTVAQNNLGPGGEGLWATADVTLTLSNNIIVSHTYGIYATGSPVVSATHTLFYNNTGGDIGGTGSISSTHEITGSDPSFVNPAGWDYHIQVGSPAVDAGVAVPWLTTDMDSDPRPGGAGYDIGADELGCRIYLPLVIRNYQP